MKLKYLVYYKPYFFKERPRRKKSMEVWITQKQEKKGKTLTEK